MYFNPAPIGQYSVQQLDLPYCSQPADGIYSLPATEQEIVTYSVYMGGDIGEIIIQTNRPDLPNVLIFGDSFTNVFKAILWTNFNETRSLDFRYFTEKILFEYIDAFQPNIVICMRDEIFRVLIV